MSDEVHKSIPDEISEIFLSKKDREKLHAISESEKLQNSPEQRIGNAVQIFLDTLGVKEILEVVKDKASNGKGSVSFYNKIEEHTQVGSFSYNMWSGPKHGDGTTYKRYVSGYLYSSPLFKGWSTPLSYPEKSIFVGFYGGGFMPIIPTHFIVNSETPLHFSYFQPRNKFEEEVNRYALKLEYPLEISSANNIEDVLEFISPNNKDLINVARENIANRMRTIINSKL